MLRVEPSPDLERRLEAEENRRIRTFYRYWKSKLRDGRPPGRGDLDPVDIPELLPNVFLLDVLPGPPRDFRFRLVGTRIVEMEGEITGRLLSELDDGTMLPHYRDALEGRIYLCDRSLAWMEKEHVPYRVLLLPLVDPAGRVNMLLGFAEYFPDAARREFR